MTEGERISPLRFLEAAVRGRCNLIVSGGAGSGKTTLLGVLSGFIPDDERLITIEDADRPDNEPEMLGDASLERDRFVAPEEEALSVRNEAPGAVDHADDHGVEDADG